MNFIKFQVLQGEYYSKAMALAKIILQDFSLMHLMSI